jgi:uncharacterized protein YndB with AHSA1/START domain
MSQQSDEPVIVIRRRFEAPCEFVYRIWTDPNYVAQWWGTDGATSTVREFDLRPGGRWRIDMRTASGDVYVNAGIYDEIVENERIVYTDETDPAIVWPDGLPPARGVFTVTFERAGAATNVTIHARFRSLLERDRVARTGMIEGIEAGLERLEQLLETIRTTT